MGLCSREPLVTVEILDKEPIKYEYMNPNKMRQVFKKHILEGEIQTPFVLAKGSEASK
jgi:NADP-reducing hydrogenase subunit HndB